MPLDILGLGLPRTGTKTLKKALEILGYQKCYHMYELRIHPEHISYWEAASDGAEVDWEKLFTGYCAATDYPAAYHWRTLLKRYPNALVILTVREPAAWYRSAKETVFKIANNIPNNNSPLAQRRRLWKRDMSKWLGEETDNAQLMLKKFAEHQQDVQSIVPTEHLLIYDVREGWEPLCSFLSKDIPNREFPWTNTTTDFLERQTRQELESYRDFDTSKK